MTEPATVTWDAPDVISMPRSVPPAPMLCTVPPCRIEIMVPPPGEFDKMPSAPLTTPPSMVSWTIPEGVLAKIP
ncbi:MAG: hypothetical protein AAF236_12750 [Verrucomicrobiota bacterium]